MRFSVIIILALNSLCIRSQVGVFSPPDRYIPEKPLVRDYFSFREFKDKRSYEEASKKVFRYATQAKAPFKVKNCIYFNPAIQFTLIDSFIRKRKIALESLKYYVDTAGYELQEANGENPVHPLIMYSRLPYDVIYRPFFISNCEVSNGEYAEFVRYVIDSTARRMLMDNLIKNRSDFGTEDKNGKIVLKFDKKIDWYLFREELSEMYLPEDQRFYRRREIDTRRLKYEYRLRDNSVRAIEVYPDTLRWIWDFEQNKTSCFEPHCNMYYWHPAFENYPLVGLNWVQAKAFLYWKTQKFQKELDAKKIPYIVEFDLPTEIELEMIAVLQNMEEKPKDKSGWEDKFQYLGNEDFDLILEQNFVQFQANKKTANRSNANDLLLNACDRVSHYRMYTYPMLPNRLQKKKMKESGRVYQVMIEKGDLKYLNSNASEWMKEALFRTDVQLENVKGKASRTKKNFFLYDSLFPAQGNLEDYYHVKEEVSRRKEYRSFQELGALHNPPDKNVSYPVRLIHGANWFDPVDPGSKIVRHNFSRVYAAHSTVGFRYVVRFRHIDPPKNK